MGKISGVTSPLGFRAGGIHCGIKKNKKALDLAVVYSVLLANCAGLFTTNKIKAAPVLVTQKRIKNGMAVAVIVNSGNANCLNGKNGIKDAVATADAVAKNLRVRAKDVLVASTGVIGRKLPVEKIKRAVPLLINGASKEGGHKAAVAIMTTDTFAKEETAKFKMKSSTVTIGGMAKGVGMICPNLATMICVITTDALIEKSALKKALKDAVKNSFNSITVDGDMSTNDMVLILANGLACNRMIKTGDANYSAFCKALNSVCANLARKMISDAEGAKKFVEINVKNAKSEKDAGLIAKKVANSPLVKTAIAGNDPNWGRIAASAGASGAAFLPGRLEVYLNGKKVLKNGSATGVKPRALRKIFKKKNIKIDIDLHAGRANCRVWTCDLTENYVKINAGYST